MLSLRYTDDRHKLSVCHSGRSEESFKDSSLRPE